MKFNYHLPRCQSVTQWKIWVWRWMVDYLYQGTSALSAGRVFLTAASDRHGIDEGQLYILQRVQNSTALLVSGEWKFCHITQILHNLHWLPMRQRIEYKEASLLLKFWHGQVTSYLSECCVPNGTKGYDTPCCFFPSTSCSPNHATTGIRAF